MSDRIRYSQEFEVDIFKLIDNMAEELAECTRRVAMGAAPEVEIGRITRDIKLLGGIYRKRNSILAAVLRRSDKVYALHAQIATLREEIRQGEIDANKYMEDSVEQIEELKNRNRNRRFIK